MSKEAYYFSHDANAKDDPKIVQVVDDLGLEGYGIFWVLVETLRNQPTYRYPLKLIPSLARKYNSTSAKIEVVVKNYGLFQIENEEFFSLSLNKRMELKEAKSLKARESANERWKRLQIDRNANALQTHTENYAIAMRTECDGNAIKESKVKESKPNEKKEKYTNVSEFGNISIESTKIDEFNVIFEKYKLEWIIKKLDSWLETKNKKCEGVKSFKAYCNNWVESSFNDAHKQTYQQQKIVKLEPNKQPNPLDEISGRVTQMYLDADFVKMGHEKAKELFWYIEKTTKKQHMTQTEINFHLFYY